MQINLYQYLIENGWVKREENKLSWVKAMIVISFITTPSIWSVAITMRCIEFSHKYSIGLWNVLNESEVTCARHEKCLHVTLFFTLRIDVYINTWIFKLRAKKRVRNIHRLIIRILHILSTGNCYRCHVILQLHWTMINIFTIF